MLMRFCPTRLAPASFLSFLCGVLLQSSLLGAEPITVRYPEGSTHGYLAIRTLDGKLVAAGDSIQTVHGGQLVSRLIYRFKDGSIDEDTAVFTQHGQFRLISDHRIQRGPTFSKPTDVMIKATTGEVIVRYKDKGQDKVEISQMGIYLTKVTTIPCVCPRLHSRKSSARRLNAEVEKRYAEAESSKALFLSRRLPRRS